MHCLSYGHNACSNHTITYFMKGFLRREIQYFSCKWNKILKENFKVFQIYDFLMI